EGLPKGPFSNPNAPSIPATATITLGQGVSATLRSVDPRPPLPTPPDTQPYVFGITSDHPDQFLGYNVTPGGSQVLRLRPLLPDQFLGYNVTPGGSQFLRLVPFLQDKPADLTFQFSKPVTAFGLAITGLGGQIPGDLHFLFTPAGGTAQDIPIAGNIRGGLVFF